MYAMITFKYVYNIEKYNICKYIFKESSQIKLSTRGNVNGIIKSSRKRRCK